MRFRSQTKTTVFCANEKEKGVLQKEITKQRRKKRHMHIPIDIVREAQALLEGIMGKGGRRCKCCCASLNPSIQ
jgi:hypothetical protein